MLFEPNRTPYDLSFRIFGIDVRVHPLFWVFSALIGWGAFERGGIQFLLVWIACVFVSILIHELGHIWMGQVFGSHGHIVIYTFGGLAINSNLVSTWWKRILVSFAGPLAGFLFLAAICVILLIAAPHYFFFNTQGLLRIVGVNISFAEMAFGPPLHPLLDEALWNLFFINFFWGLINLLPVFPLDGGQISRDALSFISPQNGYRLSLGISLVIAGVLAVHCFLWSNSTEVPRQGLIPFLHFGGRYAALMFALLAFQSFMQLQQQQDRPDPHDPWMGQGRPWER
jgi:stage IV sporulation protein FB